MDINESMINIWIERGIKIAITITISVLLYNMIAGIINKSTKNNNFKTLTDKKAATYIRLMRSINKYLIILATFLIILQILGININSIVTGVGILGAIFGLAIQDWLKDIIRGSNILSDNYFQVGDVIKYKDIEGKVLILGLKTTKIQDLKTGNIISIANRNIDEIEIVSNYVYVNIPMPYEIKVNDAENVINEIIENIKKQKDIKNCIYKSVNELGDSSILYLIEIECDPIKRRQVKRNAQHEILITLEKNNISVPYNQIDIHQK